ncbi:hypothetical protein MMA231_03424 [Asticcacaulis sp. MM231]|uniref:hypothetical protein n=1 Tax=Asticcacaulis sp. MM231 TaxID=3157666 RepID=UPI0032D59496
MKNRSIYIICGIAVVVILAIFLLNMPDNRTGPERVGDAVTALPDGVDKAGDQLKDRNPVEKAGDAIEKTVD